MADTALHLVDKVIPEVPVRQWVCSLPWRLRVLCGYDKRLCAEVLDAFVVEVSRSHKRRAKALLGLSSVDDALTGAVSVIQRGDSALRLNVHVHLIALDGVYVRSPESGELVFHALTPPTAEQITDVATRTAQRVEKILTRHGRTIDGTGESDAEEPHGEQLALAALCGAAAAGHGLTGDRAGEPLLRVVDPARARKTERVGESGGFNVHAAVAVSARDRAQLERLCRYLCRPPIAQEIRYHGVLSSHAKARAEVVPKVEELPLQLPLFKQGRGADRDLDVLSPEPRRKPWAWLLRHVFAIDVSTCPRCGGPARWLEAATKPEAIARLLAKHGLGPRPPPKPPPKGQLQLAFPSREHGLTLSTARPGRSSIRTPRVRVHRRPRPPLTTPAASPGGHKGWPTRAAGARTYVVPGRARARPPVQIPYSPR